MGAASGRNAPSGLDASERRVLNPRPFRVFRKSYSVTEAKAGAVVLLGLALLGGWVAWRGAHPDPGLFADPAATATGSVAITDVEGRRAPDGPSPAGASRAESAGNEPSSGGGRNGRRPRRPPGLARRARLERAGRLPLRRRRTST